MAEETSPTSGYTMGYSEEFQQLLKRRSLETHAAHLLPYLKHGIDIDRIADRLSPLCRRGGWTRQRNVPRWQRD